MTVLSLYVKNLWTIGKHLYETKVNFLCFTCAADSSADSRRQNGAVGLSDWLWAANQIQAARCSCPGQTHETGHSRGEVTHLHGLERKTKEITR